MRKRDATLVAIAASLGIFLAGVAAAQPPLRNEWGDPDFSGVWDSGTLTPLERPEAMKDREYLTEEEAAAIRGTGVERVIAQWEGLETQLTGELNETWLAPGTDVVRTLRTSLVIDPPDGKIPYTPEGKQRSLVLFQRLAPDAPADGPEVRHLGDRCLVTGMLYEPNPYYLNHHLIVQTQDQIVIQSEIFAERRIISLDGRPAPDPSVTFWSGSSRGHFEGETLVVETTNFNGKSYYFGATDALRTVERFTRVDEDTLDYQVTFSDPASFERSWTLENTLRSMEGPIYEYACHEGNYALGNILRGARLQERLATERTGEAE